MASKRINTSTAALENGLPDSKRILSATLAGGKGKDPAFHGSDL